jgi:hypothetical protein
MNRRILAAAAMAATAFAAVRGALTRRPKAETPSPRERRPFTSDPQTLSDAWSELAGDTYAAAAAIVDHRLDKAAGPRVAFGDDGLRAYEAVVSFRSNNEEFATDTVKVRAKDNLSARTAAFQAAEDSRFYDVRVPDIARKVLSCKLVR